MEYLKNISFITSVFDKKNIIKDELPIIAMVGKSNVGKSSFINAIANNSKIAKVGNSPGKTRSLNYFLVDELFYLVDLPGYGYAKMSKSAIENMRELTSFFLETSTNIKHIFFLVDSRHLPTAQDKIMYNWLVSSNIEFSIILNKSDKLSKTQQEENKRKIEKELFAKEKLILFSSLKKENIEEIMNIIKEKIL